jgi:hypothetical protein
VRVCSCSYITVAKQEKDAAGSPQAPSFPAAHAHQHLSPGVQVQPNILRVWGESKNPDAVGQMPRYRVVAFLFNAKNMWCPDSNDVLTPHLLENFSGPPTTTGANRSLCPDRRTCDGSGFSLPELNCALTPRFCRLVL